MAKEEYVWTEFDKESHLIFFFCSLCPLTLPFFELATAEAYLAGHLQNSYHRRRLELLTRMRYNGSSAT